MYHTFDFSLLGFVHIFLVICNNSLGEGLTDGVDLRDVASSSHSDSDVQILESFESEEQDGFEDLSPEGLGLQKFNRRSVDSQYSLSGSDGGDGN
jgi:hypothetical protein